MIISLVKKKNKIINLTIKKIPQQGRTEGCSAPLAQKEKKKKRKKPWGSPRPKKKREIIFISYIYIYIYIF